MCENIIIDADENYHENGDKIFHLDKNYLHKNEDKMSHHYLDENVDELFCRNSNRQSANPLSSLPLAQRPGSLLFNINIIFIMIIYQY